MALYGRVAGGSRCKTSRGCGGSKDLTPWAAATCNWKQHCKFIGTNGHRGDPCKVNKYTAIKYNCIKSESNLHFNLKINKVRPDHYLQCNLDCTDMSDLIIINELCTSVVMSRDVPAGE